MSKFNNLDVIGLLQEHGALLDGHFKLPSGFHSQSYVQTSLVMQYPHIAQRVAKAMVEPAWRKEEDERVKESK